MADTEQIAIVQLSVEDAQAGVALSTEAHWNQNEADWRFFLKRGIVFGVRDDPKLAATAALPPSSPGKARVSQVRGAQNWRRARPAPRPGDALLNPGKK